MGLEETCRVIWLTPCTNAEVLVLNHPCPMLIQAFLEPPMNEIPQLSQAVYSASDTKEAFPGI